MLHSSLSLMPGGAAFALFQDGAGWLDASLWAGYWTNFFVVVIWILFFAAVIVSARYLRRLGEQREALRRAESNAKAVSARGESDPEFVAGELLAGLSEGSIIAGRIREVKGFGQRGCAVEQAALAETLAVREAARTSFARYVASVLVLLGLCGAIYGLSNLVRQMGPELRKMQELSRQARAAPAPSAEASARSFESMEESVSALVETMAGSLEHTRGAFAASLTGIGLSVLLLFLNWFVGRAQASLLAGVEGLTASHLLPLFAPSSPAFELSGAVNSLSLGAEHAAGLAARLDDLTERANESFSNLFVFFDKFREGASAIEKSQQRVADSQATLLALAGRFTELTEKIEQHQAGSKGDISRAVANVNSTSADIKTALDDWGKRHENILGQLQQIASQWTADAKALREKMPDQLTRAIGELRAQALESFQQQQKFNQDQISRMLEEQKRYIADLQAALLNGQGHKELVDGVSAVFKNERDTFSAQFKEFIEPQQQTLLGQLEQVVARQGALVERLETLTRAVTSPVGADVQASPPGRGVEALARAQRETNQAVQQISHYAERLIAVAVVFVSGAGGVGVTVGGVAVGRMLGLWPDAAGGQAAALIALLAAGATCCYALSRLLLPDSDD